MVVKSRPVAKSIPHLTHPQVVVLGNGPSAKHFINKAIKQKPAAHLLAVNKFAIDPVFFDLKPDLYLLHDGDFFLFSEAIWNNPSLHPRTKTKPEFEVWQDQINKTWRQLLNQNWGLTLFIPRQYLNTFIVQKAKQASINIQAYNYTVTRGFQFFKNWAFDLRLGMPQCQNVINAAIFHALHLPIQRIYCCGLDHDFHRNLIVGPDNTVYESVSHFYTTDAFKHPLVHADGSGRVHLRQVFENLAKLHQSYFELNKYAHHRKIEVINITPQGFVDEFKRMDDDVLFG
ncbi:MAG: hypothetical protein RLZZ504_662 [Bacteroidota bacterium]|jgi:hypothetical protein